MRRMKNIILGYADGYSIPHIKNWADSIVLCGHESRGIICGPNTSSETKEWLKDKKFLVFEHVPVQYAPVVTRFFILWDILQNTTHLNEYEWIVFTDVKDVIFQESPDDYIEYAHDDLGKRIIAGSENVTYRHEPWGKDNITRSFGAIGLSKLENEILNAGTFAAYRPHMKDLCESVFLMSVRNQVHNPDQAAFNIILRQEVWDKNITISRGEWALQCGTVLDPEKHLPQLVSLNITMKHDLVMYNNTTPYIMVHQYDRVPWVKEIIDRRYGKYDRVPWMNHR